MKGDIYEALKIQIERFVRFRDWRHTYGNFNFKVEAVTNLAVICKVKIIPVVCQLREHVFFKRCFRIWPYSGGMHR